MDELTAEEGTEEAVEALTTTDSEPHKKCLRSTEEIAPEPSPTDSEESDDDWDDWDDEPTLPPAPTLSKKERKQLEREKKRKEKEKKKLSKKGYDVDQVTRPDGSRVDST